MVFEKLVENVRKDIIASVNICVQTAQPFLLFLIKCFL